MDATIVVSSCAAAVVVGSLISWSQACVSGAVDMVRSCWRKWEEIFDHSRSLAGMAKWSPGQSPKRRQIPTHIRSASGDRRGPERASPGLFATVLPFLALPLQLVDAVRGQLLRDDRVRGGPFLPLGLPRLDLSAHIGVRAGVEMGAAVPPDYGSRGFPGYAKSGFEGRLRPLRNRPAAAVMIESVIQAIRNRLKTPKAPLA
jgi:hypothetical protein